MTIPSERARSIIQTRQFLIDIAYNTKRIPKEVKELAKSCLRHYPMEYDVQELSSRCPDILETKDLNHDT